MPTTTKTTTNQPQDDKKRKAIRSERIKLTINNEQRTTLETVAELCQRAQNRLLFEIKRWHIDQGNDTLLRNWIIQIREYQHDWDKLYQQEIEKAKNRPRLTLDKKAQREARETRTAKIKKQLGPPPKCPVQFLPAAAASTVRQRMIDAFPTLHDKVLSQLIYTTTGDLARHQCSVDCFGNNDNRDGRFKKWHRIIADLGEQPTYTHLQPIPLKPETLTINIPEDPFDDDATWTCNIRLDRHRVTKNGEPVNRTDGKPLFHSDPYIFELITKEPKRAHNGKPKLAKIRHTIRRCYGHAESPEHEYTPKGAKISEYKGEWYLHLPYQQKKWVPIQCDKRRTAILQPAQDHPWLLIISGQEIKVKGHGHIIARVRERLLIQGMTRREAAKGGRDKARGYRRVHRRRVTMETFKRTFTRQSVAQIIRILADRQIGKLELHLPNDPHTASNTFLAKAGTTNRPESWSWDFVKTEFQRQADRLGFELIIKQLKYPESHYYTLIRLWKQAELDLPKAEDLKQYLTQYKQQTKQTGRKLEPEKLIQTLQTKELKIPFSDLWNKSGKEYNWSKLSRGLLP